MKKVLLVLCQVLLLFFYSNAQTPINLASQSGLTYFENFADINTWMFNTIPANGTFTSGVGAAAWKGIDLATTTPAVPNATRITTLSNFFQTPGSSGGVPIYSGGLYKGTQSIVMLSTGPTDNTSSIAIDLFLDFTSVNAGTLSFDWASLNNSTGNRNGSLKVYASTDGVAYTEIVTARVSNFTNNSPTAGNVTNVALPSIFNGSATARLRFYYHNGTGGTAGSRPRINLDNVKVTALPTTPCTAPTAQPTSFVAGTVLYNSAQFSFTAAIPAPHNYLVVISKNNALSSYPVNSTTYNIGDNLGDGTVVAVTNTNSVSVTGLTNSIIYYFFIFSMNNVCSGGPLYFGTNPLIGSVTTLAGQLPCVAPTTQPTNLVFSSITATSITGSFTAAANTDEYLIVRSTSATFTGTLNNGTTYNGGNVLGNGSVVTRTAGTSFTANNLSSGVQYFFYVFGINNQNCNAGPIYNSSNPLTTNTSTISLPNCLVPTDQPTQLNLIANNNSINGYFTASSSADGYIVIRSLNSSLLTTPTNGITYVAGNTIGGGTVISNSAATSFIDYNLSNSTQYYYFIFARNAVCNGGVKFLVMNPLTANATTTAIATNNYYFGNLHAHSSYSDGNVDNKALTPSNNYAYAKNSLCMDFLGISEHNHLMNVANYQPGLNQAAAATNTNFLALYGMEYGVISNGGHVLIYGSNQLIGWDNGNYDVYVPKSDYIGTPESTGITGLFRTINNINNQLGNPAFASFAHPDFSDYNNLANIPYNATADSALVASAVASGPAFSTNTTYSDPPSSMGHLDYYMRMLSKGYHIGPFMDHDSHYTNFGRSSNNRLAVYAPNLSSSSFFAAMKARHFYATEDCDTKINFTINNEEMGSITFGSNPPAISILAIDPTNPTATPSIKIMYGVLGNGLLPVQLASGSGSILCFTDNTLAIGATGYYYADITIAGNRTITSPIWYTKANPVPVTFISFNAIVNNNRTVMLQWKTTNEINNEKFIVEKSADGVMFTPMSIVNAKREVTAVNIYNTIDLKPNEGVNYYRLKQVDKNGKYIYSNVVSINLYKSDINAFSIYPNPVGDLLQLNINSTNKSFGSIVITDVSGRVVKSLNVDLIKGYQSSFINLNTLHQGNYQITLTWNNQSITQKLIKF
jgi:hypothetical protein